jgi:hypothetical protein
MSRNFGILSRREDSNGGGGGSPPGSHGSNYALPADSILSPGPSFERGEIAQTSIDVVAVSVLLFLVGLLSACVIGMLALVGRALFLMFFS